MPQGRYKSRTFRRIHVKTPGGRLTMHYEKRKPSPHKCAGCGAILAGIPRARPYKMATMPKTKKRPERMFGGYYCPRCLRKHLIAKARG